MKSPVQSLLHVLERDERIFVNGELRQNTLMELAIKHDPQLIARLLSDARLRSTFFVEAGEATVFLKDRFIEFIGSKEFLPNSYTRFRNQIGLSNGGGFLKDSKDVVINFPYKDCILEGGQDKEDVKRDEVFYNEVLAAREIDRLLDEKVLTNVKKFEADGERPVDTWSGEDNLLVKGNNLMALYSLRKQFLGRIKLIYLDVPYNTGSDSFGYNDKFNVSTWLTFMKNRLDVAKDFLRDDGLLFLQTSYHMYPHIKLLLDEIFQGNYICTFHVMVRHPERILKADKEFHDVIEYVVMYAKDRHFGKLNKIEVENKLDDYVYEIKLHSAGKPITLPDGKVVTAFLPDDYEEVKRDIARKDRLKKISIRGSLKEGNSSGRFYMKYLDPLRSEFPPHTVFKVDGIGNDSLGYRLFYLPGEGRQNGGYYQGVPHGYQETKQEPYANFLDFVQAYNNVGYESNVQLRNGKKPEALLDKLFEIAGVQPGDWVMDFFLGSGTTASVAHKKGVRYIGIEQMDYGKNSPVERLKSVIDGDQSGISEDVNWKGGGSFVSVDLMKWNQTFKDMLQEATSKESVKAIYDTMKEKAFLDYRVKLEQFEENMESFMSLPLDKQKEILYDLLDKNQLYVNVSEIDDETFRVSEADKQFNRSFYQLP